MTQIYFDALFVLSMLLAGVYVFMWHKHFDMTFTIVFMFVPVCCLGYAMYSRSRSLGEAVMAMKISYVGGCYLQYFITMAIFKLCEIKVSRWVNRAVFLLCSVIYFSVLSIGYKDWFYKDISFDLHNSSGRLIRTYGPMHTVFVVILMLLFAASFGAIVYSYFRKRQVSRRVIFLLFLPDLISLLSYTVGKKVLKGEAPVPAAFVFAEVMYLLIAYKVSLYDVSDTVIDSMVRSGDTGFISFDLAKRYIGSNPAAQAIIPELSRLYVDAVIDSESPVGRRMDHWLESYRQDPKNSEFLLTVCDGEDGGDERIYTVAISDLYIDRRRRGYMVTLRDDTQKRRYIRLLDNYNEDLQNEVSEKTRHIVEMHDNLIMSLAVMVESRDNSTGGHIKRTSVGVRILIEEMVKAGAPGITEEFCHNMAKAAPMHDLGKIAVDDAVLRKPGRFTPEEFEKMKAHAAEGARVIHEILKKTDDEPFKVLAENVAHYHHERWDGSGYPEGLKGEEIPFEARIMAVADVYDALVSKRVYKERMSFEKADSIIMEGMGTQFDPSLEKYYVSARPRLEEYYSSIDC